MFEEKSGTRSSLAIGMFGEKFGKSGSLEIGMCEEKSRTRCSLAIGRYLWVGKLEKSNCCSPHSVREENTLNS